MKSKAASRLPPDVVPPPVLDEGTAPLPGRTFIRNQGCWNCRSFESGELYAAHRLTRRLADMKALVQAGVPLAEAERRLQAGDRYLSVFNFGVCLAGGGSADFVPARFKCHKWTGRGGLRTDAPQDPLADELKDLLGDPT